MKFSENGNRRLTFCHWFKVSDITVAVGLVGSVSVFPLGQKIACSFNSDFLAKIPIIGVSVHKKKIQERTQFLKFISL